MSALDVQVAGDHYKKFKIQPIEFTMANNLDFCQGNIIKYACRHEFKNGKEDLLKIKHYVDLLIEAKYPDEDVTPKPSHVKEDVKEDVEDDYGYVIRHMGGVSLKISDDQFTGFLRFYDDVHHWSGENLCKFATNLRNKHPRGDFDWNQSTTMALKSAFDWHTSPEGFILWSKLYQELKDRGVR